MSGVYAINYYYMSNNGARTTELCCGTVNNIVKAKHASKLLKMLKLNDGHSVQINIVKQKRKIRQNYELTYVLKPEHVDEIRINYLSKM